MQANDTQDVTNIMQELTGAGSTFKGKACTCPFHRDTHPSAGVYESSQGNWRFKCHVCDVNFDLIGLKAHLTGKTVDEILRESADKPVQDTVKKYTEQQIRDMYSTKRGYKYLHEYTDLDGVITHFVAIKYLDNGKKEVRQVKRYGFNFIQKNSGTRPLFRLDKIKDLDTILIVEGEKCVLCAEYCGLIATTCMGGCLAAKKTDLGILSGKNVIIWPDNDVPGAKMLFELKEELKKLDCKIGIINNSDIGNHAKGADIADYFALYQNEHSENDAKEAIRCLVKSVTFMDEGVESFYKYNDDIFDGKYSQLDIGFPMLQEDSRYTEGGQITLIIGGAGTAKSFFLGQHFVKWKLTGKKVKIWSVENNREFHAQRCFAQIVGDMHYCDKTWIARNKVEYCKTRDRAQNEISKIMDTFYFSKKNTKEDLINFCTEYAEKGYDAVAIDPVTFFADSKDKKSFEGDNEIMYALNDLIDKYHTRFYLVTHPRTDKDFGIDNVAGSRGYGRFCQNALWLTRIDKKFGDQKVNVGFLTVKTRSGTRTFGGKIGFYFNPHTALFEEVCTMDQVDDLF